MVTPIIPHEWQPLASKLVQLIKEGRGDRTEEHLAAEIVVLLADAVKQTAMGVSTRSATNAAAKIWNDHLGC